ncbi:MAG TPA: cupin domain-containing protein [Pseudolabrys sp.]|jgi:mannose-6-phosphate isomerase-like protein (cupin superfamily)
MKPQIVSLRPQNSPVRRPFVTRVDDIVPLDTVPGEQVSVCVRGADVGGAYTILRSLIVPDGAVPMHIHQNEDEVFHIIEGCLHFHIGKAEFNASPGATVVVPKGAAHAWRNMTEARVLALIVFTPGGIDRMFDEIAGRSPRDIELIALRYGTIVVGP